MDGYLFEVDAKPIMIKYDKVDHLEITADNYFKIYRNGRVVYKLYIPHISIIQQSDDKHFFNFFIEPMLIREVERRDSDRHSASFKLNKVHRFCIERFFDMLAQKAKVSIESNDYNYWKLPKGEKLGNEWVKMVTYKITSPAENAYDESDGKDLMCKICLGRCYSSVFPAPAKHFLLKDAINEESSRVL